jgi:hypothetical protein
VKAVYFFTAVKIYIFYAGKFEKMFSLVWVTLVLTLPRDYASLFCLVSAKEEKFSITLTPEVLKHFDFIYFLLF